MPAADRGFLVDGGTMGALMRGHDWSTSPLGAPETWPQALRTVTSLLLTSKFPMFVAWGPELGFLYNGAYAEILGAKHPAALGERFHDIWAEIWPDISPLIDAALAGEASYRENLPLLVKRKGFDEEAWFTFSYSPVRDESGQVAGMFCAVAETTGQVLAERRQSFRIKLEEALGDLTDPRAIMAAAVEALGLYLRANRTGYSEVQADGETIVCETCYADGVEPLIGTFALSSFGPDSIARQRSGQTEVCDSIAADPRQTHATWAAIETDAFVSVPLVRDGRFTASLYVNFRDAHQWSSEEVALIEDAASRTWSAVERARAEEHLRESEAQFRLMADAVPQIVWITDGEGRTQFFNRQWSSYTGVTYEPTTAADVAAHYVHPDDGMATMAAFNEARRTGGTFSVEHRIRSAAGEYRWFLVRGEPYCDPGTGEIVRWFGASVDIHDRKLMEEALRESEERLRDLNATLEERVAARTAERNHLWTLTEDMLARADYEGRMSAVNPAWTRVLGWSEQELLTNPYADIIHPDDVGVTVAALLSMGETKQPTRFENRILTSSGEWKPIGWTVSPEPDGQNFIAVGRDLADYRAREQLLLEAQEALRQSQKLEAVGQLTGGVAHDFNNLLTIIRSSVEFLRRPDLPEERRRRYIDAITDTVDRAAKLTGQLLAFARRQALKPEVFDVPERIQAVTDMLRTIVGSRIKIITDISCERCFVEADVVQFETALVNMAVNARDAMDGEGTLTVHVDALAHMPSIRGHAGAPGKFVAVSISDTGSGIPTDRLSHIFEPFFTTKEVGKGTGLGLSQVYGFAKQSGGDVAVESGLGKGTTFTLYLPKVEREAGADETAVYARTGAQQEDGRGCRVLVVEDNLEVGQFATQLLQDLGYETAWAANATEALDLLENNHTRFDVVFSDVVMPGMSGIELGREIRQRYPALPVVLTSGYSHVLAEEGRHGFELLHKPYAVEDVSRVLRRVTRRSGSG
ncbi:PAS domain S-box protein [Microvirga sp. BT688]|nr:PAS domain S-box protein [Microvirga sp.]